MYGLPWLLVFWFENLIDAPWPGHLPTDQIGRHCRQLIQLSFRPVEFDHDISAFEIAGFTQALAESSDNRCRLARGPAAQEMQSRHPLLLRMRRERPSCRCAAERG